MINPRIRATLFALALLALAGSAAAATYDIDASHSSLTFKIRHMMVSKVSGRFEDFSGALEFDPADPAAWSVSATIGAASIDTDDVKRDEHLRNPDFFDVETHPEMTFVSTGVETDGDDYVLNGELTMMGVTKPVALELEFNGEVDDPWGNTRAGFSAEGEIDRRDFGMVWNKTMDKGGVVVGNTVEFELEIEAVKRK